MSTEDERHDRVHGATPAPADHAHVVTTVYHYSEDGTIRRFAPHVPQTNPSHPPSVWTIDAEHSPLFWFPRDCPRISVWARTPAQQELLSNMFATESHRICAAESHWLAAIRDARIYRYSFDAARFVPWGEADGQYVSVDTAFPDAVDPLDDLLALHTDAGVELRFTPRIGRLMDQMLASGLPFSFVRIRDALS